MQNGRTLNLTPEASEKPALLQSTRANRGAIGKDFIYNLKNARKISIDSVSLSED
jgi:hypothetical protein